MNKNPDAFVHLINVLKILPSAGSEPAQHMAYRLLQYEREEAQESADTLQLALRQAQHCRMCSIFYEDDLCEIYADERHDKSRLMIVHMPAGTSSMEATNCHDSLYFVLMEQASPVQGVDIPSVVLGELVVCLQASDIEEIIITTNLTVEGDATTHILTELFKNLPYKVNRLVKGILLGGEVEYMDVGTLAQAVYDRRDAQS